MKKNIMEQSVQEYRRIDFKCDLDYLVTDFIFLSVIFLPREEAGL